MKDLRIFIDRLKICYRLTESSILHEIINNPNEVIDYDLGYYLQRVERTHFENCYEIIYRDYKDESMTDFSEQVFGVLQWGLRSDKNEDMKHLVWIQIDNKQFYLPFDRHIKNRMVHLEYIEDTLGLVFNNITKMEIAIDSTINFPKKLLKMIRNKDYTPIIQGTKRDDRDQIIEEIIYYSIGTLDRIKEHNILIGKKKDEIQLNAYNKLREIQNNSHKDYISEANDNPRKLFRLEVRIGSDPLKNFFTSEGIEYNPLMFTNPNWLWLFFLTFSDRVIRFTHNTTRKPHSIIDLLDMH